MNSDTISDTNHLRRLDLSQYAGKTIASISLLADGNTAPGSSWQILYKDIALVSADGTVRPIYTEQKTLTMNVWGTAGSSRTYQIETWGGAGPYIDSVHFYHGDHLGSARLLTNWGGWPIWSGTYLPFGAEWTPTITENHLKFTSKERDSETGLDYFTARYFGSNMGRFMSPDPLGGHNEDPQTLNRYSYVRNNPLTFTDPTGLDFHLRCTSTKNNVRTCQNGFAGEYVTNEDGDEEFRKTVVHSDGNGRLVDQDGNQYSGTFDGKTVTFRQAGSDSSLTGDWIQGSKPTSGITGGGQLDKRFSFTFLDHGKTQPLHAIWSFAGNIVEAENSLRGAGFQARRGVNVGFDEFRNPALDRTSTHFNVDQVMFEPKNTVPTTYGNVHTGEYDSGTHLIKHAVCDVRPGC